MYNKSLSGSTALMVPEVMDLSGMLPLTPIGVIPSGDFLNLTHMLSGAVPLTYRHWNWLYNQNCVGL